MADLGATFSVDSLPQGQNDYTPIPAGWYTAKITDAELKSTKSGTGQYIKVRFDVMGPSHEGRVIFTNLNIRNSNPKAEEIAHQQLRELMIATGLNSVQNTDQLIGGMCSVKVAVRKSEEYGDQNEVKGYKAIEGTAPTNVVSSESASVPPWKR